MFRPRVIPALLLMNGGLVKTTRFSDPVYIGDPINAVKIFNDAEADELIFLDINATRSGVAPDPAVVRNIADEAFMPFGVGGGLDSLHKVKSMFDAGAEKVILNSAAVYNPELITQAASIYGSQAVVMSVDVRREETGYVVYTASGSRASVKTLNEVITNAESAGAGEIFINSIDRDGTREGYDLKLIETVASLTSLPVIACGGAGDYNDFNTAIGAGALAVAAGSIFVFVGRKKAVLINYPDREEMNEIFVHA